MALEIAEGATALAQPCPRFPLDRVLNVLKVFGVSLGWTILIVGFAAGNFFATVSMTSKPNDEGNYQVGAAFYIIFVVAMMFGCIFVHIASRQECYKLWTFVVVCFTGFVVIECAVASAFSFHRGVNDVDRSMVSSGTSAEDMMDMIQQRRTVVIHHDNVQKEEFGQFVDLSGGRFTVYRMRNMTSIVLAAPLIQSQDDRLWLNLIPQEWIVPVTAAIMDLRERFPNTTLQAQVVAITGSNTGRKFFDAKRKLEQTEWSFFIGLAVFGLVMGFVMPVVTLYKM